MQITDRIHRLKIEFHVTPEVKRFVYLYIIEGRHLYLIDTGVDGAEETIKSYLTSIGRRVEEIAAILLTHSHPDHIGAADKICQASHCKVYACAGEQAWIENIDKQFAERAIPNFYKLVNQSVKVSNLVQDGDILNFEEDITIRVVNAAGHSQASLAYHFIEERALFTGDAIPVVGDIPIYISAKKSLETLACLGKLQGIDTYLSAWDEPKDASSGIQAIQAAIAHLRNIDATAREIAVLLPNQDKEACFKMICKRLDMEKFTANPLFKTSIFSNIEGIHEY